VNKKQAAAIAKYRKALETYRLGTVARRAKVLELIKVCTEEESDELEALGDADGDVQTALFGDGEVVESNLVPYAVYSELELEEELPDGNVSDQTDGLETMIKEAEDA
jgi:hypothetical protein